MGNQRSAFTRQAAASSLRGRASLAFLFRSSRTTSTSTEEDVHSRPTGDLTKYGDAPQQGETAAMVREGADVRMEDAFIYEVLATHNRLRARHGSPPLRWSLGCADWAQAAADHAAELGELVESNAHEHGHGQNAFYGTPGDFGAQEVIEAWYDEKRKPGFSWPVAPELVAGTQHFSQVVWHDTLEIGMACDRWGKGYVYANYWPAGNVKGLFDKNVFEEDTPAEQRKALPSLEGVVGPRGLEAIVSFPGKYEEEWNEMVGTVELLTAMKDPGPKFFSTACVFLPHGHPKFGEHCLNDIDDTKLCFCFKLYGHPQPWGCQWFDLYRRQLEKVRQAGQQPVVVYKAKQACLGDNVTWNDLPVKYDTNRKGLGPSQAAEVALLKRMGMTNFLKRDVRFCSKAFRRQSFLRLRSLMQGDRGCARLAMALQKCDSGQEGFRHLVAPYAKISKVGAAALGTILPILPELQQLDLTGNTLRQEGIAALLRGLPGQLPHLQRLKLSDTGMGKAGASSLAAAVPKIPGLKEMWLGGNGICKEDGPQELFAALPELPHLEVLGLNDNQLGKAAAGELAHALPQLSNLKGLMLGGNRLATDKDSFQALVKVIPSSNRLRQLDLSDNGLHEAGSFVLAQALPNMAALEHLDLGNNWIGEAGAMSLSAGLAYLNLKVLWLDGNNIGETAMMTLASNLQNMDRLKKLGVGRNRLREAGTVALAGALPHIPELTVLCVQNNGMNEVAAEDLCDGLKECEKLERLILSNNKIGEAGATALAATLKELPNLRRILLNRADVGQEGMMLLRLARPDVFHFQLEQGNPCVSKEEI